MAYEYSNKRSYNSGGNYRSNNGGGNYRSNNGGGQKKKHSGSKMGNYVSNGKTKPWVNGWNYSRAAGLVKILCTQYKGTHQVTSKSGKVWQCWIAQVTPKMGQTFVLPCLYCETTRKVIIQKLGLVLNPHAPNGGYCGTFVKK